MRKHIVLDIEPKGKPRIRFGGFYKKGYGEYLNRLKKLLMEALGDTAFIGPVRVDILCKMETSTARHKRLAAGSESFWAGSKPDRDNIDKFILDAITTLYKPEVKKTKKNPRPKVPPYHRVWQDDSLVVAGEILKVWCEPGESPRVEVIITEVSHVSPQEEWDRIIAWRAYGKESIKGVKSLSKDVKSDKSPRKSPDARSRKPPSKTV